MSTSAPPPPTPSPEHQERVHQLWDQLATYPAARAEEALLYLLDVIAALIDAQNAYWMGVVRLSSSQDEPLDGWRPRALRYLQPLVQDKNFTTQRLRAINQGQVDESVVAQTRLAGTFRAHRLRDIVSPTWFETDFHHNYLVRGIHDSLTVAYPVNAMTEAYYGFLRMRPDDPFTESQCQIAAYALRGLGLFHRRALLAHGVGVADKPLSPFERKTVALLLTDKSEKAIATTLGVTSGSAHTYIRNVFHKLGVSGRAGLAALWLGQCF